jgi:hypothetical protein
MVFGFLGKKKPSLKLEPKQEVEIEFCKGEDSESFFTPVLEVQKKKIILKTPSKGNHLYHGEVGDDALIIFLEGSSILRFKTKILEVRDKELDIAAPTDIQEEKCPFSESNYRLEIPIPVEYRAISTAHLQTATTKEINSRGIKVVTNLPIPNGTEIHIELEIPDSPMLKTKGRVVASQKVPSDVRKSITDIEFEDFTPRDSENVFRYAILYQQRRLRRQHLT